MAKYKFELIGVSFLYEMLDFNYDTKLIDIKNTLDQWRRRMLTLIRRQLTKLLIK